MVNAMAPNAPSGANFMTIPTIPNSTWDRPSMNPSMGAPRLPRRCSAKPNSTANSSTWSISPLAKASTTVVGMALSRNSVTDCIFFGSAYAATEAVSSVAGSTFMPLPGRSTLITINPRIRAAVLITSK